MIPIPADIKVPKIRKHAPRESAPWKARTPREGEAPAAVFNTFHKDSYRHGDGDVPTTYRPGSMVAFSLPSVGQRC